MPRPREVPTDVLASTDEIAQRLLFLRRDANERQTASRELAHKALGIPGVGLDPVRRPARNQPGRADTHLDAPLKRHPRELHAGRPGLIDRHHPALEARQELDHHLLRRAAQLRARQLTAVPIEDRDGRLRRMDIQPNPAGSVRQGQHLPAMRRPTPPSLRLREAFARASGTSRRSDPHRLREVLTVSQPADRTTSAAGLTRHTV
jgi:hypothetical protein